MVGDDELVKLARLLVLVSDTARVIARARGADIREIYDVALQVDEMAAVLERLAATPRDGELAVKPTRLLS